MSGASLGYEYLRTKAREAGWRGDAQDDFSDPAPAKYLDPPANSNEPKATKPSRKRLAVLALSDLDEVPEPDDFIENLLCIAQLSLLYGDTNIGKSFWALAAALYVAMGQNCFGRDTDPGVVIYVAGEGAGGMKRRIAAYLKHHGIADPAAIPFVLVPDAVDFRDKHATDALIEAAQQVAERFGKPVRWIIVDTLSRALAGGNENAPDDMGALVRGADRVRSATGAHLTFIHHTGKDETKGARGHSLLRAAVDTELEVKRQEGAKGVVCVNVTKQRDLEIGAGFAFRLVTVDLGTNRRGKPITSCVVEPAEIKPVLTEAETEAIQILQTLLVDSDEPHVELAGWRKAVMCTPELLPGQTPDAKTKQWQRLRDGLKKKGIIVVSGSSVWVK